MYSSSAIKGIWKFGSNFQTYWLILKQRNGFTPLGRISHTGWQGFFGSQPYYGAYTVHPVRHCDILYLGGGVLVWAFQSNSI